MGISLTRALLAAREAASFKERPQATKFAQGPLRASRIDAGRLAEPNGRDLLRHELARIMRCARL